jgi:hypothetical protein
MTDPNRPIELCEKCWEEYDDYWNERCEDYRRSQGRTPGTPGTPGKAGSIEGYGVIGFTDSYPELDSYPDELPES